MFLIALASLLAALFMLCALCVIDLRTRLLPDVLTLPLLASGMIFHAATNFYYSPGWHMVLGLMVGAGLLYTVRIVANHIYQQDALGLGDVKLMAAAGIWLGPHDVLFALIVGALAGVAHGLAIAVYSHHKTGAPLNLGRLTLPAGPGFISGIIITGIIKFRSFFDLFL